MTSDEAEWWLSREIAERVWWAQERGFCCWAGATASPGPCPWHPLTDNRDALEALAK